MTKIDPNKCFAYNQSAGNCRACTEMLCEHKECPFYKTRAQVEKAQGKSAIRLLEISENNPKLADQLQVYGSTLPRLQKIAGKTLVQQQISGGEAGDG